MDAVHYRRAELGDLEAIVALHVATWRHTYRNLAPEAAITALGHDRRRTSWAKTLSAQTEQSGVLVATSSDRILGFVATGPASQPCLGTCGEIKHLYLDHTAQRQGIGRALLRMGFETLRAAGHSEVALAVVEGNEPAERFYKAMGGQTDGQFTDAGPLWKSINNIYRWSLDTSVEKLDDDAAAYAEYSANFAEYNQQAAGWTVETFSMVKRDPSGQILAGGRGHVYLGALEIRGLWVDPSLRGYGLGSALLTAIEMEARRRGAAAAMLYTYSWQAEAFYRQHGYREFARFEFPHGHARIDMKKPL